MNPSVTLDTLSHGSSSSSHNHRAPGGVPPPIPADNRNVVAHHPWLLAEKARLLQTSFSPLTGNHVDTDVINGVNELRRRYMLALNELTADTTACLGKPVGQASSDASTGRYGESVPLLRSTNPIFPHTDPPPRIVEASRHPAGEFTSADILLCNFQERKPVDLADGRKILRTVTQSPTCTALPRCYYDYKKAYAAAALTNGDCGSAVCTSSAYQPPAALDDQGQAAQNQKQLLEHLSEVGAVQHQQARFSHPAAVPLLAKRFSNFDQVPHEHHPGVDSSTAASTYVGRDFIAGITNATAGDPTSHNLGYVNDPFSDSRRDLCKLDQRSLSTPEAMIDHYRRVLQKTNMIYQEEEAKGPRPLFPHASMDGPIVSRVDLGSSVDRQLFGTTQGLGSEDSTQHRKRSGDAGRSDLMDEAEATKANTTPRAKDGSQEVGCHPSKRRRKAPPNGPLDYGGNFVDLTAQDDDPCRQTIRYFNNGVEVDEEGTPI